MGAASVRPRPRAGRHLAGAHGLTLRLRGNGLVFVAADSLAIKASSVSRDLSKVALERRLGPFEGTATAHSDVQIQYRKRPVLEGNTSPLYERYLRERETALSGRHSAALRLRQRDNERLRLASRRRRRTVRLLAKGRVAWMLWGAYARHADRRERDRARQRRRAAARAAAKSARAGWLEWLRDRAARGDANALAALRDRGRSREHVGQSAVWGEARSQSALPAKPDSVTATGTVIYRVSGGTIRDDGKRMHLIQSRASSDAAAEALLRLAYARYGPRLGVDGDESFRAQLERVAAIARLQVTFVGERVEQRRAGPHRKEGADHVVRRGRGRSR